MFLSHRCFFFFFSLPLKLINMSPDENFKRKEGRKEGREGGREGGRKGQFPLTGKEESQPGDEEPVRLYSTTPTLCKPSF